MGYYLSAFGSTALPLYGAVVDISTGPSRLALVTLPCRTLYDAQVTGQAERDSTRISYKCVLYDDTEAALDSAYQAYRALRGTRGQLWRTRGDGRLQWTYARLMEVAGERRAGEHYTYLELTFQFQMLSRDWYSDNPITYAFAEVAEDDDDLAIMGAVSDAIAFPLTATVMNVGDQMQPSLVISVRAGDNTITALSLTNNTTGHVLAWAGTLTAGKLLHIDCGAFSVENNGTDAYSELTPPNNREEWMALAPGQNDLTISITSAGTGEELALTFYAPYA